METKKSIAKAKMQEATKLYLDAMVQCMQLHGEGMNGIEAVIFSKDDGKYYRIKLEEVREGDF